MKKKSQKLHNSTDWLWPRVKFKYFPEECDASNKVIWLLGGTFLALNRKNRNARAGALPGKA